MGFLTWRLLLLLVVATHAVYIFDFSEEQLPDDCGRFLNFKYFVGNRTELDDYPWLALLEYDTPRGKLPACGGVLLSSRYVLTAGHCAANLGANWTLSGVRLGEYDISTPLDCLPDGDANNSSTCIPEHRIYAIERRIVHEKYRRDSTGRGHDLALLRLAEDVVFGEFVRPICLPTRSAQPQRFQVAGWGKLAGRRGTNFKLMSYITLANGTTCRNNYAGEKVIMAEDQFCAGGKKEEEVCIADSGGPMMGVEKMADGSYRMAVFGLLTTDSKFCDVPGWSGIFVDVLTYRDWILRNMKL
ncbi:hypothetical protein TSAR_015205 [Trichomalopsis sarcophagae]|uniref:Peptidase S1 domain-containing protein n=1 Tax=Trichomalopsis sarcophagae TaxID=543379 RepID=A0A232FFV0_9HYME|nr:hypothetical protein TSAR_015205 [Trichomalopsis sarcophagae]